MNQSDNTTPTYSRVDYSTLILSTAVMLAVVVGANVAGAQQMNNPLSVGQRSCAPGAPGPGGP